MQAVVEASGQRLALTFGTFEVGRDGIKLAAAAARDFFGCRNYETFKEASRERAKNGGRYLSEETRLGVDQAVFDKIGGMFAVRSGEDLWARALKLAYSTVMYARGVFYADQQRQGFFTTNIDWDDGRPSTALERLTLPTRLIGERGKYEQGRQLGLAMLCAELISSDENGHAKVVLSKLNEYLEDNFFTGRKADTNNYHTYSFHAPHTNRLVALSPKYPDSNFGEELWVKSLEFPVRKVRIQDGLRGIQQIVPVLYISDQKGVESAVIKAKQRSLKDTQETPNGGLIETLPHSPDRYRFKLVVMGDRYLRDAVTARLESCLKSYDDYEDMEPKDSVKACNGNTNRVEFRRRMITVKGLKQRLEGVVQTLEDYITELYEVGEFDPRLGRHNGPAHDLYKLGMVADIAPYLWPIAIYGRDIRADLKVTSYEYANRLGRKQRIYPALFQ